MQRAGAIMDSIMIGKAPWKDLFARHTFFTEGYKYYLAIVSSSKTKEAQLIWSGLVESKVRLLVANLENVENIEIAHPFNKGFDRVHHCPTEDDTHKVINGDLSFQEKGDKTDLGQSSKQNINSQDDAESTVNLNDVEPNSNNNLKSNGGEVKHTVYTTTYYIGLELKQGKFLSIITYSLGL